MGRWDKQEQQSIQQQIRELVLSVNSRGLNEKCMGINWYYRPSSCLHKHQQIVW